MGGDSERGGKGGDAVTGGVVGCEGEIVAEAAFAALSFFRFVFEAGGDLPEPGVVIVGKGGEGDAFGLGDLAGFGEPFLEFLARVDIGIREEHRHFVAERLQTRNARGGARTAATMQEHFHFCVVYHIGCLEEKFESLKV